MVSDVDMASLLHDTIKHAMKNVAYRCQIVPANAKPKYKKAREIKDLSVVCYLSVPAVAKHQIIPTQ